MKEMTGISILIVEDEPSLRQLIVDQFKFRGAQVSEASNGRKAWALIQSQKFDVVLSDIRMPGGDGIELMKNIYKNLTEKPAVFMCTGFSDLSLEEAQDYGVLAIFEKPFDMKSVVKKMLEVVRPPSP